MTKEKETKSEAFERLVGKRLPTLLDEFRKMGNLATGPSYEYTEDRAGEIMDEIELACDLLATQFGVDRMSVDASVPAAVVETPAEPVQTPEPAPAPKTSQKAPEAPRTRAQGYLELSFRENLYLVRVGPQIGTALEAIDDRDMALAKESLVGLLNSKENLYFVRVRPQIEAALKALEGGSAAKAREYLLNLMCS